MKNTTVALITYVNSGVDNRISEWYLADAMYKRVGGKRNYTTEKGAIRALLNCDKAVYIVQETTCIGQNVLFAEKQEEV